jgi:enoyl-CoA hydratase
MTGLSRVLVEIDSHVAVVTVNRPGVRNALDRCTIGEMTEAFTTLGAQRDVGAVVVTGAGDRVFVAGGDIREIRGRGRDDGLAAMTSSLYTLIERCPKPTIAAINGHALGGGCELALACDLRVTAAHATFGQPEIGLGIIPGAGGTQRLPRVIGLGRAAQLVLTGEPIDAQTALAWGLVATVVPADELMGSARALAARLLTKSALALRLAKIALHAGSRMDLEAGLMIETLAQTICLQSEDKTEGTTAFLEKRLPKFRQ